MRRRLCRFFHFTAQWHSESYLACGENTEFRSHYVYHQALSNQHFETGQQLLILINLQKI